MKGVSILSMGVVCSRMDGTVRSFDLIIKYEHTLRKARGIYFIYGLWCVIYHHLI